MITLHDTGYFHYHQRISTTAFIVISVMLLAGLLLGGWWFGRR